MHVSIIKIFNESPQNMLLLDIHDLTIIENNHATIKVACTNSNDPLQLTTLV